MQNHTTKTKITQKRAAAGGEYGANGAFYEGGKFIATTEKGKGAPKPKAPQQLRKVQIAPYEWVMQPHVDARPILASVGGELMIVEFDYDSKVCKLAINENVREAWYRRGGHPDLRASGYPPISIDEINAHWAKMENLVERFNNGERWE